MRHHINNIVAKVLWVLVLYGCSRSSGPNNPNTTTLQITSIHPTSGAPGSLDTVEGRGFDPVPSSNTVFFGNSMGTVINATSSQLIVRVPDPVSTGNISVQVNGQTVTGPVFTARPGGTTGLVEVSTIAGNHSFGHQDGAALSASFAFIWDIASDYAGNIYVADGSNNLVRRVSTDGMVTTLAGSGSQGASTGAGTFFYYPIGVDVDQNNHVYVANQWQHKIQKITAQETVTTMAGGAGGGFVDGTGSSAGFYLPTDVAVDATGNVFVVDQGNNAIRKVTPSGVVTTFAGGTQGSANGVGTAASFSNPNGIAIDNTANLYVADMGNFMIRKITPAGVVTTVAGLGNPSVGEVDGPVSIATFATPMSVAVDANGVIYVADYTGNKIRKISTDGIVSTLAGTGADGSADGPANMATFNGPSGLAVDGSGNIYVADGKNYVIRKIVVH